VSADRCLILVLNSGSSSLKFAVHDTGSRTPLMSGLAERLGAENPAITFKSIDGKRVLPLEVADHAAALDAVLAELSHRGWLGTLAAVGHRVVLGGERFTKSSLVTPEVVGDIEACSALAPLHNPAAVLGIRARASSQYPARCGLRHRLLPDPKARGVSLCAANVAIPRAGTTAVRLPRDQPPVRGARGGDFTRSRSRRPRTGDRAPWKRRLRYRSAGPLQRRHQHGHDAAGRTGHGHSLWRHRRGGGTAHAVLHIMRTSGLDLDAMDALLNKKSGLLGLSELSNDCRELEAAAEGGHKGAQMALAVFADRLARHIGGLAMALRRLDAVLFTGGIGENSVRVRAMTVARLRPLFLTVDEAANAVMTGGARGVISTPGVTPFVAVVPTNEEWMIACDTAELAGRTVGALVGTV
jgi:acetate kinase